MIVPTVDFKWGAENPGVDRVCSVYGQGASILRAYKLVFNDDLHILQNLASVLRITSASLAFSSPGAMYDPQIDHI